MKQETGAPDPALLRQEYFHLHTLIESFDGKSLTIKAWSVSLAGAIAGAGAFSGKPVVLLFAALASLMFWLVDSAWKTFQYAHYRRVREIEAFLRGELAGLDALQIATRWSESFHDGGVRRFARISVRSHVFLPNGAMCLCLLAAWALLPAAP